MDKKLEDPITVLPFTIIYSVVLLTRARKYYLLARVNNK